MGLVRRFLTGPFEDDASLKPGIVDRGDLPTLVKRDLTEVALEDLGGNGGSQPVLTASVTLTDAQIKVLPTTPVEIVSAQGVGTFIVPLMAWIISDTTAGGYTNFNAFDAASPYQSSVYLVWDAPNNFQDATGPAPVEFWLSGTNRAVASLSPASGNLQEVGGDLATGSGLIYAAPGVASAGYDNTALYLVAQNNNKGNFTGGDPANTLKATVLYTVIAG